MVTLSQHVTGVGDSQPQNGLSLSQAVMEEKTEQESQKRISGKSRPRKKL